MPQSSDELDASWERYHATTATEDADGPLLGGGESVSHAFADTAVCGMLLQGGARPGVAAQPLATARRRFRVA